MNVTSVRGLYPCPGYSAYHATKYALETMTDSLRLEMSKFRVKVAKIQPGNFCMVTGSRRPQLVGCVFAYDVVWENPANGGTNSVSRDQTVPFIDIHIMFLHCEETKVRKVFSAEAHTSMCQNKRL